MKIKLEGDTEIEDVKLESDVKGEEAKLEGKMRIEEDIKLGSGVKWETCI